MRPWRLHGRIENDQQTSYTRWKHCDGSPRRRIVPCDQQQSGNDVNFDHPVNERLQEGAETVLEGPLSGPNNEGICGKPSEKHGLEGDCAWNDSYKGRFDRRPRQWKNFFSRSLFCLLLVISVFASLPSPSLGGIMADLSQVHHHMSTDELRDVFHVESHDKVPKYDVVRVNSKARRKRSTGNDLDSHPDHMIALNALGKDYHLHLEHNEDFHKKHKILPMFSADAEDGDFRYEKLPESDLDVGIPYQDVRSEAAVLVTHDPYDESLVLDGVIGDNIVIRPAPISVKKHYIHVQEAEKKKMAQTTTETSTTAKKPDTTDEAFLAGKGEMLQDEMVASDGFPIHDHPAFHSDRESYRDEYDEAADQQHAGLHIIYKREKDEDFGSDYMLMEPDGVPTASVSSSTSAHVRRKRAAPYVIYPEILVIVDYDGYVLHNGDNRTVKKYVVSFWNGVDLRYRLLKDPRIRVSIAGIIISRGRDATPYLERNKVGRDAIDSAAALTDMGKYLFIERRLPTYDIAVVVTRLDMCRRRDQGSPCNRGTAGFAYVGGACVVNKRLEKVNSVAIVEDTGGFSGIIVAAHEVGHLLGAVHDGTPPPSYLGGPGATKCRWEDGFIMSDLRHTERGFQWSSCSVEQFHHFLNGDTATCLYNPPHEDESLPRYLPGKLLSLDAQCRKDRGTSACFKDDRVCAQLFCFDAKSGYCVSYRPAAEGSPCGHGQYCINGKCVVEHENAIPDFSELPDSFDGIDRVGVVDNSGSAATHNRPILASKSTTPFVDQNSFTEPTAKSFNAWTWPTPAPRLFTTSSTTTTTTTTTTPPPPPPTTPVARKRPIQETRTTTSTPWSSTTKRSPWWTSWRENLSKSTSTSTSSQGILQVSQIRDTTTPAPEVTVTPSSPTPSTTPFWSQRKPKWPPPPGVNSDEWLSSKTKDSDAGVTKSPFKLSSVAPTVPDIWDPLNALDQDETCEDVITNIAGSLTCHEFLRNYGFRYCHHRYIQKNCCHSHKQMCRNIT